MSTPIKPLDLSDSVNETIKNVSTPLAKSIGTTLADCWYLVFGGLSYAAEKKRLQYSRELDVFKDELSAKIEAIPNEKTLEPDFQIVTQALDASKYCLSKSELRHMFSSLIANTMHSDYTNYISATFPNILRQMNSYDAKLFNYIRNFTCRPIVDYVKRDENGLRTLCPNITVVQEPFLNFELQSLSLSSLSFLGLVAFSYSKEATGLTDAYYDLEHNAYIESLKSKYQDTNNTVITSRGICQITSLGQSFAKICLDPEQFPPFFV